MGARASRVPTVRFKRRFLLGGWGTGIGGLSSASGHILKNPPMGDIVFELDSGAVRDGYHFNTGNPTSAFWVDIDNGVCPPQNHSHPDIDNIRVASDRVTVNNRKCSGPVRLRYQLNVHDRSGNLAPIDPIIEN
jgi:hypothetical protein